MALAGQNKHGGRRQQAGEEDHADHRPGDAGDLPRAARSDAVGVSPAHDQDHRCAEVGRDPAEREQRRQERAPAQHDTDDFDDYAEIWVDASDPKAMIGLIQTLAVRGAPLIGVAAGQPAGRGGFARVPHERDADLLHARRIT